MLTKKAPIFIHDVDVPLYDEGYKRCLLTKRYHIKKPVSLIKEVPQYRGWDLEAQVSNPAGSQKLQFF